MTAFNAIVKLTLRNAMRSHIFQLLLALLVLCSVALPMTVSGSGEGARAYIQIALKYSLGTVGFILALSTVWIASLVMTQDVENYQLHMVVAKPVSRIKIFIAKYLSVVLLHAVLLLLAGITIFGVVLYRYSKNDFPAE
ncbi:MAG: ABC transporter permease [Lentisphaeria bacterium]|nr:ABC transporter permease [Lentisphaeria bacterium]